MCFSTIFSCVLHKYFAYIPHTPLSNGPSVNKVLSCLAYVNQQGGGRAGGGGGGGGGVVGSTEI